ncbi:bifunctional ADP-dependent NAD(P)H-hydrate dehydratase/NAD(P)H-hydrate epimerase [Virgibacillus proomii]|uniref:bifunctional ADP-dependent NAD(P)H-hydrate dehydratase/NAD(P)H-hydrate epimerase n=1 Tax=Virgibacillus proomii TaxID=84407 RepID=UPI0009873047|nr:bifunctional ADP-dependent NAD(P)H-hydrate dehydratase/NAD(P)H-hydrate epimerase [Virgibacillus proomii]
MYIVTAKEMYDIDHFAMHTIGLDGKLLMENAGRAVAEKVTRKISKEDKICVLVGAGNNGGDGFVIARTLLDDAYDVNVLQIVPDEKITGDAHYHKQVYENCGGTLLKFAGEDVRAIKEANVLIDAMIGIGVDGDLREPFASLVPFINKQKQKLIISVDIPSGLPANEGVEAYTAIKADHTIIIGAPKLSVFLNDTFSYYGSWEVVSIGLPTLAFKQHTTKSVWNLKDVKRSLPKREPNDHKGKHGKGIIIGGCIGMPGALSMSIRAALRAGAGLITGATSEKVIQAVAANCVEAMYMVLSEKNGFLDNQANLILSGYHAVAIGMGIGRRTWTGELVQNVIDNANCPLIIDADGLYHLSQALSKLKERDQPTVITPHPGEMAMLLGVSIQELLQNPFRYASEFAKEYRTYVVLKGQYTMITSPDGKQAVNQTGNPGLSKGGSGDVLTGIILAMIMQKQDLFQALCNACFIHGLSADLLVIQQHSEHDLLASDVINGISAAYRMISDEV